ncbi:hypothetical protein QVD17_11874 [Tagetes erecta]|uniref:Reverse transcriptase zinc-binding domain-containing protein n=1 Tax=Tagetes erecta TaxID=13708 RepID=A0AAD8NVD1_TARER|nr:hypothetical protein QVD17_11874 [Tagetes erecta]
MDASGTFSVASMRSLPHITNDNGNFNLQWNNWAPIKANIFAWRAAKDRIATRSALRIRGIQLDSNLCPLCGDYEEDADHLLVSCFISNMVWHFISSWCKIPPIYAFSTKDLLEVHKSIDASKRKKKLRGGVNGSDGCSEWHAKARSTPTSS